MTKTVLHVGCGRDTLPAWLDGCNEVRLDIDPDAQPDIVASMTDLGEIGPFDGVLSQHSLEHLSPADGARALAEFRRVLKPGGLVMIAVPDLEDMKPDFEVLYVSPGGPISGHDMFYGASWLVDANPFMAHKAGYVQRTLHEALERAGFHSVEVKRIPCYNLMAVGVA